MIKILHNKENPKSLFIQKQNILAYSAKKAHYCLT